MMQEKGNVVVDGLRVSANHHKLFPDKLLALYITRIGQHTPLLNAALCHTLLARRFGCE